MSMMGDQGQQVNEPNGTVDDNTGQGTETTTPVGVGENGSQPTETTNPFLAAVDEADRAIVQKYIDKWDANVTRRMTEQARQFEPYRNLGDVEQLQRAVQLYEYFQQNPQDIYQRLHAAYGQQQQQQFQQGQQFGLQQNGQGLDASQIPEEFAPYFQQFDQRFGQFDQRFNQFQQQTASVLEALANHVLAERRTQAERQQDEELDKYLGLLKTEFGEFDEEYVLTKMQAGMSGDQAVQAWNKLVQERINAQRTPPPGPTLNGGGGTPPTGKNVAELSRDETRQLVASVLERTAKGG